MQSKFQRKPMRFEREFVAAGGLLTGYAGVVPGYGDQRNIAVLGEAGFTSLEAIQIATLNGAKFLGRHARVESSVPGKQADAVVLTGNAADKIENVEKVELVFKDGGG